MGDLKLNLARPRRYVEETFSIENMVRQCIALHQEAAKRVPLAPKRRGPVTLANLTSRPILVGSRPLEKPKIDCALSINLCRMRSKATVSYIPIGRQRSADYFRFCLQPQAIATMRS